MPVSAAGCRSASASPWSVRRRWQASHSGSRAGVRRGSAHSAQGFQGSSGHRPPPSARRARIAARRSAARVDGDGSAAVAIEVGGAVMAISGVCDEAGAPPAGARGADRALAAAGSARV